MTTADDGLLIWQRAALARGESITTPPSAVHHHPGGGPEPAVLEDGRLRFRLDLPRWDLDWHTKHRHDRRIGQLVVKRYRPVWDALNLNNRNAHWSARAKAARQVITDVVHLARYHRIPAGEHLAVTLLWAPGDRRRADPDNLHGLNKVCCDALARGRSDIPGLHLVPDDTKQYMAKDTDILDPPANGLWLVVDVMQGSAP